MYEKNYIQKLVNEHIDKTDLYLVNLSISAKNCIRVFIDSDQGVPISECIKLSRYIESQLDRETEDFELEVSSYGIGEPFLLKRQYHKNLNKQVKVIRTDGTSCEGELLQIDDKGLELGLVLSKKQIKENHPAKLIIEWDQIKETHKIISFK